MRRIDLGIWRFELFKTLQESAHVFTTTLDADIWIFHQVRFVSAIVSTAFKILHRAIILFDLWQRFWRKIIFLKRKRLETIAARKLAWIWTLFLFSTFPDVIEIHDDRIGHSAILREVNMLEGYFRVILLRWKCKPVCTLCVEWKRVLKCLVPEQKITLSITITQLVLKCFDVKMSFLSQYPTTIYALYVICWKFYGARFQIKGLNSLSIRKSTIDKFYSTDIP